MIRNIIFFSAFYSQKAGAWLPGVKGQELTQKSLTAIISKPNVAQNVASFRATGDSSYKKSLPSVCWQGYNAAGVRQAAQMVSTGLVITDNDHCSDPRAMWAAINTLLDDAIAIGGPNCPHAKIRRAILAVHITPSGKGLRLVVEAALDGCLSNTVAGHMEYLCQHLQLDRYGKFDTAVKDLSRLSFLVPRPDWLLCDYARLFNPPYEPMPLVSDTRATTTGAQKLADYHATATRDARAVIADTQAHFTATHAVDNVLATQQATPHHGYDATHPLAPSPADLKPATAPLADTRWRGHLLRDIARRYVEVVGEPGDGDHHLYYNKMLTYFRHIADNSPEVLAAVLPRFGRPMEYRLSQCQSICRENDATSIPKPFYDFLVAERFINPADIPVPECTQELPPLPQELPPVFREWLAIAPPDFRLPVVNALLPIIGTLTSYVRAPYYYDGFEQSTTFFSIIYAPSGSGKSFVKRLLPMLDGIKKRDQLNIGRQRLYDDEECRRGANKELTSAPKTVWRVLPAKTSETELLTRMERAQGHHLFTFCPEIDSWIKGVHAAGGDKDDMIRLAWDNDTYGQTYKSAASYRGTTRLYWNVLMTGTPDQMHKYFSTNTENGLVQRCSFVPVQNQRFARAAEWGTLTAEQQQVVADFVRRCDANTYQQPLQYRSDYTDFTAKDYDDQVAWRSAFRPMVWLDMGWLRPTIDDFVECQRQLAAMEGNDARDSWRKRVALRGFRLGMECTQVYDKAELSDDDKRVVADFVRWWMECDIALSLQPFEEAYNKAMETADTDAPARQAKVRLYDILPAHFTRADVLAARNKLGQTTNPRQTLFNWKRAGLIDDAPDGSFVKCEA